MAHYTPGSFISYRAAGSGQPMWPAVVCTDDVAPASFLHNRPLGYVTLILRVGESLDLCWASSSEMHNYDPFVPFEEEDIVERTPGLGEAYAVAASAIEAGLGLDHWRDQVRSTMTIISSDDDDGDSAHENDREVYDEELRMALRLSLRDYKGKQRQGHRTRSPSPFKQTKKCNTTSFIGHYRDTTTEDLQSSFTRKGSPHHLRRSEQSKHRQQLRTPSSSPSEHELCSMQNPKSSFSNTGTVARPLIEHAQSSSKITLNANNLLSWGTLGKSSSAPTSDTIEGHLATSKEFVLVRVGAEHEERLLHKNCVWNRTYFLNMTNGTNFFDLNDNGRWELIHPELCNFQPEEFNYIAEYLESGSFGYVNPQGEVERQEAFIQLIEASQAAEKLGMTDLMEHIVEKLERLGPWDLWNIMCFACIAYTSPGPHLPIQERLKDMLATEIAQNYWIYIEDDNISTDFIQRLKDLPELERDIYESRSRALNERLNSEGEDGGENDEDEDGEERENHDLYED